MRTNFQRLYVQLLVTVESMHFAANLDHSGEGSEEAEQSSSNAYLSSSVDGWFFSSRPLPFAGAGVSIVFSKNGLELGDFLLGVLHRLKKGP